MITNRMRLGMTLFCSWPSKVVGQNLLLPSLGGRVACSEFEKTTSAAPILASLAPRRFWSLELGIRTFISTYYHKVQDDRGMHIFGS